MADQAEPPSGGAHLRTVAMPRDANAAGDIFGGWTLSQMDLAGGTFAAGLRNNRVVTSRIEEVRFLRPVKVGDDVSVHCALAEEGETSIVVDLQVWARDRTGPDPRKVAQGRFTYVTAGEDGEPIAVAR